METSIKPIAEVCAAGLELVGIMVISAAALFAIISGIRDLLKKTSLEDLSHQIRQRLGRGILFGLEFLMAADIVHTVAVELNPQTVGVLAVIVLIRTFLSFTLEVELTGKWPWQQNS